MTEDKKIPETALSGETVSEITDDTAFNGIDNDIIPDVSENVKPAKSYDTALLNPAVDDAVLDRIEKIRDRITEMQFDISNYENELNVLEEYHLKYLEVQNNGT